jgi:hypothetical protein
VFMKYKSKREERSLVLICLARWTQNFFSQNIRQFFFCFLPVFETQNICTHIKIHRLMARHLKCWRFYLYLELSMWCIHTCTMYVTITTN